MKRNLTLAVLFLSIGAFAQTKSYSGDTQYGDIAGDIFGTEKYTYKIDEYGSKVMHGTYSFSGKKNLQGDGINLNCSYNLSVGMVNGKFNGQFSQSASYVGKVFENWKWKPWNSSSKCSGVFLNGKPNGLFTCTISEGGNTRKCTATLKDGHYCGTYLFDNIVNHISGQLTNSGALTGQWTYKRNVDKFVYNFQNDVLISVDDGEIVTPPALQAIAKKYAAGSIKESDLLAQGIFIEEDSLPLDRVIDILFADEVGLYQLKGKTDGATFADYGWKKYKKLVKLNFLTDEGFELLLKNRYSGDFFHSEGDGYPDGCGNLSQAFCQKNKGKSKYGLGSVSCVGKFIEKYTTSHAKKDYDIAYLSLQQESVLDSAYRAEAQDLWSLFKSPIKEILCSYIEGDSTKCATRLNGMSIDSLNVINRELYTRLGELVHYVVCISSDSSYYMHSGYDKNLGYYRVIPVKNSFSQALLLMEEIDSTISRKEQEAIALAKRIDDLNHSIQDKDAKIQQYKEKYLSDEKNAYSKVYKTLVSGNLTKDTLQLSKILVFQSNVITCMDRIIVVINNSAKQLKAAENSYPALYKVYKEKSAQFNYNCSKFTSCEDFDEYQKLISTWENDQILFDSLVCQSKINKSNCDKISNLADKSIFEAYKPVENDYVVNANFKESLHTLKQLEQIQKKYMQFGELSDVIGKNDAKIVANSEAYKTAKEFQEFKSTKDLSPNGDIDKQIDALKNFISAQDSCLIFIDLRKEIDAENEKILANGKQYKEIVKVYTKYFKSQDFTWEISLGKLRSVLQTQKVFSNALVKENISDLNNQVKKSKDKSLENVLGIIGAN